MSSSESKTQSPQAASFKVIGSYWDTQSYFCEALVKRLAETIGPNCSVEFETLFEIDFLVRLKDVQTQRPKPLYGYSKTHLVLQNGNEVIGDSNALIKLAKEEYGIEDAEVFNSILFNRMVRENTYNAVTNKTRQYVYMEFAEMGTSAKSKATIPAMSPIIIELFNDVCPKACDNFVRLITGKGSVKPSTGSVYFCYLNCPIHRIVKNGWLQCGDIVNGSGANSVAASTETGDVQDESFTGDFGFFAGGMVGMANSGAHSNGSQFFITLGSCAWMNTGFVGLGRVVQGFSSLKVLNGVSTQNEAPTAKIVVNSCGVGIP